MSTKQNLCRYVIFSQNCCFVANFVDKGLVNDSTNGDSPLLVLNGALLKALMAFWLSGDDFSIVS